MIGVQHNIIAPKDVIRFCSERHVKKAGRSWYNPNATVAVCSVQTLLSRADKLKQFVSRVQLWDIDEAHHCLPGNQWGKATELFRHARGLGVTATPIRCDRKGLDGIFNHLVIGPTVRELINQGHLSEYRIFCPPASFRDDNLRISKSTGEYVHSDVVEEARRSRIVGDVVAHYLRIAPGARGLTFTVDVESATQMADAYNAAGVPAAMVSAKTPDRIRTTLLERLASGDIKQIVNVDLFGEGMDCPSLEVVSMARPTQSYGLYIQQFGRALRTHPGKTHGIVIDHVGNVARHGLPDKPRVWSLSAPEGRRARKPDPDDMPISVCEACFQPYERFRARCPYCDHKPVPAGRSGPEMVDGDLIELDPATLDRLRGEISRLRGEPQIPYGADEGTRRAIVKRWNERIEAHRTLEECIAAWAGVRKYGHGEDDHEIMRRFYHGFGVDMATALTLGRNEALAVAGQIREKLT